MRKLIMHRKKTMVACLCAVRVFVSCPEQEATLHLGMNGVPCKELGKLKNGKTLCAEIPNDDVTVFVVFSRTNPNKYHSAFAVRQGEDDVTLYTEPQFDPAMGNPFIITA